MIGRAAARHSDAAAAAGPTVGSRSSRTGSACLNDDFLDERRGRTEHEHLDGARRIEISRTTVPLQLD